MPDYKRDIENLVGVLSEPNVSEEKVYFHLADMAQHVGTHRFEGVTDDEVKKRVRPRVSRWISTCQDLSKFYAYFSKCVSAVRCQIAYEKRNGKAERPQDYFVVLAGCGYKVTEADGQVIFRGSDGMNVSRIVLEWSSPIWTFIDASEGTAAAHVASAIHWAIENYRIEWSEGMGIASYRPAVVIA